MNKILLLIPQHIFPVTDGGKQGLYYPIKILAQHYQVKALVFVGKHEKYSKEDYLKINVEPIFLNTDKRDNLLKIGLNIFQKLPFKFQRYYQKTHIETVINTCSQWQPNIVICHHAHLALYGKIVSIQFPNIKLILREHNIEYLIIKQYAQFNTNYLLKLTAYWQYLKAKKFEQKCWSWFHKVLFISNSDIDIAVQYVKSTNNFYLLPDGANLVTSINQDKQNAFLFAGTLTTLQNAFNLKYFINRIWIPWKTTYNNSDFELWITGNQMNEVTSKIGISQKNLQLYNIKVLGFVEDIQTIIQSAKYFLSPTIVGAGIRMKVLEAMCNGCVVFLTKVDKAMLQILNDHNIVEYNNLEDFEKAFKKLQASQLLYDSVSKSAYDLACSYLTWDTFNKQYLQLISRE